MIEAIIKLYPHKLVYSLVAHKQLILMKELVVDNEVLDNLFKLMHPYDISRLHISVREQIVAAPPVNSQIIRKLPDGNISIVSELDLDKIQYIAKISHIPQVILHTNVDFYLHVVETEGIVVDEYFRGDVIFCVIKNGEIIDYLYAKPQSAEDVLLDLFEDHGRLKLVNASDGVSSHAWGLINLDSIPESTREVLGDSLFTLESDKGRILNSNVSSSSVGIEELEEALEETLEEGGIVVEDNSVEEISNDSKGKNKLKWKKYIDTSLSDEDDLVEDISPAKITKPIKDKKKRDRPTINQKTKSRPVLEEEGKLDLNKEPRSLPEPLASFISGASSFILIVLLIFVISSYLVPKVMGPKSPPNDSYSTYLGTLTKYLEVNSKYLENGKLFLSDSYSVFTKMDKGGKLESVDYLHASAYISISLSTEESLAKYQDNLETIAKIATVENLGSSDSGFRYRIKVDFN